MLIDIKLMIVMLWCCYRDKQISETTQEVQKHTQACNSVQVLKKWSLKWSWKNIFMSLKGNILPTAKEKKIDMLDYIKSRKFSSLKDTSLRFKKPVYL